MGLFSGKTKTYVASTVYNMAGDTDSQPNLLRSLIVNMTLAGSKESIGSILVPTMLSGPGMKQRRFFKWAQSNYELGLPSAVVDGSRSIDSISLMATLQTLIGVPAGSVLRVLSSVIDYADIDYWARTWVMTNYPAATENDWSADWDALNQEIVIEIPTLSPNLPVHFMAAPEHLTWALAEAGSFRKLFFCSYQITSVTASGQTTTSPPALFTYQMGTGNAVLDALNEDKTPMQEFFPVLPLRLNNVSIRDSAFSDEYATVSAAYKKLTDSKVDELLDSIEDNESIADIDYCFLVQGAALNTKDKEVRRYLYRFFENLIPMQKSSKLDFDVHKAVRSGTLQSNISWERRLTLSPGSLGIAPTAATEPVISELRINSPNIPSFDHRMTWVYVDEAQFQGNGKTYDGDTTRGLMKVGEFWFTAGPDIVLNGIARSRSTTQWASSLYEAKTYNRIYLFHQHSRFAYSRLEIVGLEHKNFVYGGISVNITGKAALAAEDISGFLVPLHMPTLTSMGLVRSNQLSTSTSHLIFNTYKNVTIPWYATDLFRIILIIAMVVVSVIFPPAGVSGLAGAGVLGSNLAIGTALGITTATTAAIVGGIANAIAATILTSMIEKASIKLFGDKVGAIVGTILSFVAMTYATSYANTGTFDVDWGKMMRIDNLSKLTNSVTSAYSVWLKADTAGIYAKMGEVESDYEKRSKEIEQKAADTLGVTSDVIDPMIMTDAVRTIFQESPESFLNRTMLTGNELAELSQTLIYDFAEMSLDLPVGVA